MDGNEGTFIMTTFERIEELQRRQLTYLDEGDEQEAYLIGLDLQALYEEQAREAGIN